MGLRPGPQFAPAAKQLAHRAETAPLLARFFDWADRTLARLSAKSALAEAFRYTIKRREALPCFLTDARLEIDNNIAENAIEFREQGRPVAVGRKNYLFAGSDAGGRAAIYTVTQTAKLDKMNPEPYVHDMLAKIAAGHPISHIDKLMP